MRATHFDLHILCSSFYLKPAYNFVIANMDAVNFVFPFS